MSEKEGEKMNRRSLLKGMGAVIGLSGIGIAKPFNAVPKNGQLSTAIQDTVQKNPYASLRLDEIIKESLDVAVLEFKK